MVMGRSISAWFTIVTASVLAAGCAGTTPPVPEQLIPVTQFVNSLKCEYAHFLFNARGTRLSMKGWSASGSMDLNVVTASTVGGSLSGLLPFQGGTVDFGLSGDVTRKYTTNTSIGFELTSSAETTRICEAEGALFVEGGIGLRGWLTSLAANLDAAAAGDPKFAVNKLNYELVFALERNAAANGGLTIVPLTLSAKALASRNDVQTIKMEFTPPLKVVGKKPDGTLIKAPVLEPFGNARPFRDRSFSPLVVPGGTR